MLEFKTIFLKALNLCFVHYLTKSSSTISCFVIIQCFFYEKRCILLCFNRERLITQQCFCIKIYIFTNVLVVPFQNYVRQPRPPTNMAARLKIETRGSQEPVIAHLADSCQDKEHIKTIRSNILPKFDSN